MLRDLSQIRPAERCYGVHQVTEASAEDRVEIRLDIEAVFCAQYERIARVIARLVRDPARSEELAVEVFLKLWRNPRINQQINGEKTNGWLYRTAVRIGLDELRRQTRRARYERFLGWHKGVPTPEEIRIADEEQEKVRMVLAVMNPRHAELLLLRSDGTSYEGLASALDLNPASVGTLLARAQLAFRKEYVKRYGEK